MGSLCTLTCPNAALSSLQTCFSPRISFCGEWYYLITSATILNFTFSPLHLTNFSRIYVLTISPLDDQGSFLSNWFPCPAWSVPSAPPHNSFSSLQPCELSKVHTWLCYPPTSRASGKQTAAHNDYPTSSSRIPFPTPFSTPHSSRPLLLLLSEPLTTMPATLI